MSEELILVEREQDIATVVLNRPHKLNALTKPMWRRLGDVMRELSADDALRCIVMRGAGDKSFAPGNDISEFKDARSNSAEAKAYGEIHHEALAAIGECRHPVVALIQGICVGGGLEIAASATCASAASRAASASPSTASGCVSASARCRLCTAWSARR